jgi:hypothetical protein
MRVRPLGSNVNMKLIGAITLKSESLNEALCGAYRGLTASGSSDDNHSYRRATSGSTFVARRAGMKLASNTTTLSKQGTTTNVGGSVAFTPIKAEGIVDCSPAQVRGAGRASTAASGSALRYR